jgi:hypothetical protein
MAEPVHQPELTRDERHLIALLRQGPQSVAGLAGALQTSTGQMDDPCRASAAQSASCRSSAMTPSTMDSRSNHST